MGATANLINNRNSATRSDLDGSSERDSVGERSTGPLYPHSHYATWQHRPQFCETLIGRRDHDPKNFEVQRRTKRHRMPRLSSSFVVLQAETGLCCPLFLFSMCLSAHHHHANSKLYEAGLEEALFFLRTVSSFFSQRSLWVNLKSSATTS
jgi:hypothetical protein